MELHARSDIILDQYPCFENYYLKINASHSPLDDALTRARIAQAIDQETLLDLCQWEGYIAERIFPIDWPADIDSLLIHVQSVVPGDSVTRDTTTVETSAIGDSLIAQISIDSTMSTAPIGLPDTSTITPRHTSEDSLTDRAQTLDTLPDQPALSDMNPVDTLGAATDTTLGHTIGMPLDRIPIGAYTDTAWWKDSAETAYRVINEMATDTTALAHVLSALLDLSLIHI